MKHIPNLITSLNLASGFASIILASSGRVEIASWLILAAMIFDFLDGFSARLMKAYSAIGKELDSLADVVSFGVAPGIIIYNLLKDSLSPVMPGSVSPDTMKTVLIIVVASVMPVCAALRLAIFNIDDTQAKEFKGLPTPANALAVISIVLAGHYSSSPAVSFFTGSPLLLAALTVALSLLMVSRMPLFSLKVADLRWKGNEGRFIMIGLILLTFLFLGPVAATLIIPLYILSSLISLLF
jgi:CDP-diacylglycerol--serine O-phosphatidyltransferase